MSPFTRNIILTAVAAILPALVGLAVAPERARALPGRIGHGVRDLLEDDSVEASLRRITARLDNLAHQIDAHGASAADRMRETSTATRLVAGIAALLVIPAALTAIFAPGRLRGSRSHDAGYASRDDVDRGGDEVGDLEEALEKQRSDAVSAVSAAANRTD